MRFTLLTVIGLAGSILASEPGCGQSRSSDRFSATAAKKSPAIAASTDTPKDAKPGATTSAVPTRKRDVQRAPTGKRCRPAHLFM